MLPTIEINTPRLTLVGAEAMNANVPIEWPPQLYDEAAIRWTLAVTAKLTADSVWRSYYVVLRAPTPIVIGVCSYKGAPDAASSVEVGYSILLDYQRQGFASEALQQLIALAFTNGALQVSAQTLPDLIASRRVMEKCGMSYQGVGSEAGVIRYAINWSAKC
jgi:[ribosomal protein S5]-alanine N-acetyltransferase